MGPPLATDAAETRRLQPEDPKLNPHRIGIFLLVAGALTLGGGFVIAGQAQSTPEPSPGGRLEARTIPSPTATSTLTTAAQATETDANGDALPPAAPLDASPTATPEDNGEDAASSDENEAPSSEGATSSEETPSGGSGPATASAPSAPTSAPRTAAQVAPTSTPVPAAPAPTSTPAPAAAAQPTSTPAPPAPTATPVPPRPTSTPVPPPPPPPPAAPVSLTGLEQEMFSAHNAQRAQAGLANLAINATLVNVARQRAQDMATNNYFSHNSPNGSTAFTLLSATGYSYGVAGENIARNNYPNAQSVGVAMTGFMNSPGHRSNILDGRYNAVGIGSAIGADGMKYFAVVFAGP